MIDETSLTVIALDKLPAPNAIEALDFETILGQRKTDFLARYPAAVDVLELESEPITKLLEESAYRELLLRQRINDLARSLLLAYATGSDLDHIAATPPYRTYRLVKDPGDPDARPLIEPTYETDDAFRARIQLVPESFTNAGSSGAYAFHALSADGRIADVAVKGDIETCEVDMYVLAHESEECPNGLPTAGILDAVIEKLNDRQIRPLTDKVNVHAASIKTYEIKAVLVTYPGPAAEESLAAAQVSLNQYLTDFQKLGYDITRSALYAALHVTGVQRVELIQPEADLIIDFKEVARCTAIDLTLGGTDI